MNQYVFARLRPVIRVLVPALLLIMTPALAGAQDETPVPISVQSDDEEADGDAALLVYHQITNFGAEEQTGGVGYPVLSADGTTIVFTDAPRPGDPATPNRILVIDAEGGEPTEVDAYTPTCGCGSMVDISADGGTVVSTDSMQVRIADDGGARELIALGSNEITALSITDDGETVFFLVRRDAGTTDGATTLGRGVWAINADGDDLRPVILAADVAELFDIPVEQTGCCFHGDGSPLDVSEDGSRIVTASYGTEGEHVIAVDGDGGDPHVLGGPYAWVMNVAISADGSTVAYDVIPLDNSADEAGVVDFDGGETRPLATNTGSGFDEPMQLNPDGSQLLLTPSSLLIDTETGEVRQLAILTPGGDGHTAVLAEGLARATMNAEATRFLYVMSYIRCADCVNEPEQLATLDLGPADLGDAPVIGDATVDPTEIPLNGTATATAGAAVEATGELVAVGLVILRDGRPDPNVGWGTILHDDGLEGDAAANDGIFTNDAIAHSMVVTRDDDTGPRTVRLQAEVESADGTRHATALAVGTLTVVAAA